jgi:hypothetical protein
VLLLLSPPLVLEDCPAGVTLEPARPVLPCSAANVCSSIYAQEEHKGIRAWQIGNSAERFCQFRVGRMVRRAKGAGRGRVD